MSRSKRSVEGFTKELRGLASVATSTLTSIVLPVTASSRSAKSLRTGRRRNTTTSKVEEEGEIEQPMKRFQMCRSVKIIAEYPHIDDAKLDAICNAPKFVEWISKFESQSNIAFKEFHITDVDFFGAVAPTRLGFVKGFGQASDTVSGDRIPSIVFLRGGAVAVLIIVRVKETGRQHVLMCKQLRFPIASASIEVCAGMLDSRTSAVTGVVFAEVHEETGFTVSESELIALGKITTSPGGSDEIIHLYAWETTISQEEFEDKQRKVFGEGAHEKIKLLFYPFEEFDSVLDEIGDVKAECCWRRYLNHKKRLSAAEDAETSSAELFDERIV